VKAGEIQWPVPEKYTVEDITTYIYHGEAVLLVPLVLGPDAARGEQEIEAKVSWLECEVNCVPGQATLRASLKIGDESKPSADAESFQAWQAKIPKPEPRLQASAAWEGASVSNSRPVVIEWSPQKSGASGEFFPYENEKFEVSAKTEKVPQAAGKLALRKTIKKSEDAWPTELRGLIIEKLGNEIAGAYEVALPLSSSAKATVPATPSEVGPRPPLWRMLLLALIGGLILNVMPCVLPVIALKVFGFIKQAKESPARVRLLGLVYGVGVLASFLVLAVLAIGVQKAGGLASWGMLLQNQIFRVVLTILITLVALNLFGLFEVTMSGAVLGAAGSLTAQQGLMGAFLNGVLATVLATPCTAPYLSAALAFAFTQPPAIVLLVFLMVGVGLAAPFVVLCWQPAWLKFLPKPGVWMEKFKIAMGFPMLATAVWIFWFTAPNFGDGGVLWLGLFLVVLAAAAWVWGEFVQRSSRRRALAIGVCLLLIGLGYGYILEGELHWRAKRAPATTAGSLQESPDGIAWQPWSPEAEAKGRAEGRPVLVDFTAKNCLNCQVNKRTSLEIPSTRAKLKEIQALALLGDFSNEDPRIAAELRRYNRPGVPLVLVYPKNSNAPPIVLPEVLTPSLVLKALAKAAE
jgi:thiol:disulfide interchange protein DsbD